MVKSDTDRGTATVYGVHMYKGLQAGPCTALLSQKLAVLFNNPSSHFSKDEVIGNR